jgi:Fe-S oxidoreductase/nitrate reductase gamma subunit
MENIPHRVIYWNINNHSIIYLFFLLTLLIFGIGVWKKYGFWLKGKRDEKRFDNPLRRLKEVVVYAFLQKRIFRDPFVGIFHASFILGFAVLAIATILTGLEADLHIPILRGNFYLYFSLIVDFAGLVALVGCLMAFLRRTLFAPDHLERRFADIGLLGLLFFILLTGFLVEGLRIIATGDPWAAWSPIGNAFAVALAATGATQQTWEASHAVFWWIHLASAFIFIAILPFTKLFHIITGPLNIYFLSLREKGGLRPVNFEAEGNLGAAQLTDLTWKDLLDLDVCTRCGRCQSRCPAYAAGKTLSPRQVILSLRQYAEAGLPEKSAAEAAAGGEETRSIFSDAVPEEQLWLCTTCRACMEECPVFIEHVPKIIEMRRYLSMEMASVPETLAAALKSLEERSHPFRGAPFSRTDWYEGLAVREMADVKQAEVLYWAGCAAAFDDRNQKVARAFVQLLKKSGVDVAVLGREEKCCGELARRTGNEYLFQMVAEENTRTLAKYRFQYLVTACPHCCNSFKADYGLSGENFAVMHHTEYLNQLRQQGRLKTGTPLAPQTKVSYQDPCYLGRYNDVYEAPRQLLAAQGGSLAEMAANRNRSFCCGGGGGRAWIDETGPRVSHARFRQALETDPNILATACPYCLQMLEDAAKLREDCRVRVMDIAEVLNLD